MKYSTATWNCKKVHNRPLYKHLETTGVCITDADAGFIPFPFTKTHTQGDTQVLPCLI